jgi:hypothetical protein
MHPPALVVGLATIIVGTSADTTSLQTRLDVGPGHASDRAPRAVDDGTAWDMTGR